ncbi:MAG: hypothetical protein QXU54_00485 [Candidatus Micrarchaeia archaeon]
MAQVNSRYNINPPRTPTLISGESFKELLASAISQGKSEQARHMLSHIPGTSFDRVMVLVECLPEEIGPLQRAAASSCIQGLGQAHIRAILGNSFYEPWQKRAFVEIFREDSGHLPTQMLSSIYSLLLSQKKIYSRHGGTQTKLWFSYYIEDLYRYKQQSLSHYLNMYSARVYGEYENNVSTFICKLISASAKPLHEALQDHLSPSTLRGNAKHNALIALKNRDSALAKAYAGIIISSYLAGSGHIEPETFELANSLV